MATTNDTWDSTYISVYLRAKTNDKKFLWKFLWDALELDSFDAKEMAKRPEAVQNVEALKKQLQEFKNCYLELRKTLKTITKSSYKF